MKAYRVELLIIDFDGLGQTEITATLEHQKYPNRCISPSVQAIDEKDIGEWTDAHPLNHSDTADDEYERLFGRTA